MDLEEERLKHQIEAREIALKQKIKALKERIEHFKSMVDVQSQVRQRPSLMLMGSILAGFITKKLMGGKNRHAQYTYRTSSRPVPMPGTAAGAIISAIATRAAVGIIGEVVGKLLPGKHERGQPPRNVRTD
jgi:hypothetical protein